MDPSIVYSRMRFNYGIRLPFQTQHEAMYAISTSEGRMHPGHTHLSSCIFVRDFQKAGGTGQASLFAYPHYPDGSSMLRRDFDDSLIQLLVILAGVPVGGKLSVCLIWNCMKYRIIILIIIIKRLGEILLSYMANTPHTHARTHTVSMYFPSQHFMILLVDDVVSSRRPITPEIHLLSLTIFTQEALVTLICMNLSVSYPNWYELK